MSKKILFFGNERLATGVTSQTPIFNALIKLGYEIPAIILSQDSGALHGRGNNGPEIISVAKSSGVEIRTFDSLKNTSGDIANYGADAAVLVSYGKIIPPSVLDIFKVGIINVHPSLLPKHRGPTPIESAILGGDHQSGVSIMKIGQQMDSGPIYAQETIILNGTETKQELADQLDVLGSQMLTSHIDAIINGELVAKNQSNDGTTYDKLISKTDGVIDWNRPASYIERQVRAFANWPKSRTKLKDIDIAITNSHVINGSGQVGSIYIEGNDIGVYTSDNILILDSLIPSGKKEMSGQSFLAGYRSRL